MAYTLAPPKNLLRIEDIARREYERALRLAGQGMLGEVGRQFVLEDAVASGKTAASFVATEPQFVGDRMWLEVTPTGDRARVMYFIEEGREPGGLHFGGSGKDSKFVDGILEWLGDRGIISRASEVDALSEEEKSILWAVVWGIHNYGFEGRHVLEKAERAYRPRVVRLFEAATRRIAAAVGGTAVRSDD